MSKVIDKQFIENEKLYAELAEIRTIKALGLSEKEALIGKLFESTKQIELIKIKNELNKSNKTKFRFWKSLFLKS